MAGLCSGPFLGRIIARVVVLVVVGGKKEVRSRVVGTFFAPGMRKMPEAVESVS
jgi:hypothetical protein